MGEDTTLTSISELRLRIYLWDQESDEELSINLNGAEPPAIEAEGNPHEETGGGWLQAMLKPATVRQGRNQIDVTLKRRDPAATNPSHWELSTTSATLIAQVRHAFIN